MTGWSGSALPVLPSPSRRAAVRRAVGVGVAEAAALLGVTRVTFHNWECGKTDPKPDNLRAYAVLLAQWSAAAGR